MYKKFITIVLAVVLAMTMSTSAFAANLNNSKDKSWKVQTDNEGNVYLKNAQSGEKIVEAYRLDNEGKPIKIDLTEYAKTLNQSIIVQNEEKLAEQENTSAITPYTTAVTVYEYQKYWDYVSTGSPRKVTPDVTGPASISYGNSVTISESWNTSITLNTEIKKVVKAGASFGWCSSASSTSSFNMTYNIASGKKGYIQFRPYLNTTYGYLTEKLYINGVLSVTNQLGFVTANSPKKLANGFADGIYELVQY